VKVRVVGDKSQSQYDHVQLFLGHLQRRGAQVRLLGGPNGEDSDYPLAEKMHNKYFIFDGMQLDASTAARLVGFSRIPWQLKSLFGVLSDALPISGRHRGPYMLLAGFLGIVGSLSLAATPESKFSLFTAGLMLLFCNVNFAMPDVMIDATVAERAKVAPERAADLQALCWGSLGAFGIPIALVSGNLLESGGARLLFALRLRRRLRRGGTRWPTTLYQWGTLANPTPGQRRQRTTAIDATSAAAAAVAAVAVVTMAAALAATGRAVANGVVG
jgi:hypothetical protein